MRGCPGIVVVEVNKATMTCVANTVICLSLNPSCISYFLNFKKFCKWVIQSLKLIVLPCQKKNKSYFEHPKQILTVQSRFFSLLNSLKVLTSVLHPFSVSVGSLNKCVTFSIPFISSREPLSFCARHCRNTEKTSHLCFPVSQKICYCIYGTVSKRERKN